MYEAIIAGASFVGLAAARALEGREILVLDRLPIGAGQASACALPEEVVTRLGVCEAILQRHRMIHFHTSLGTSTTEIPEYPYVTVNYPIFCRLMAQQRGFPFRQERILGAVRSRVYTSQGNYQAKELIDCTGWRRALVQDPVKAGRGGFGLEVEVKCQGEGLHFYFDRGIIPHGLGWVFPCGQTTRIGVADFTGRVKLRPALDRLIAQTAPDREITGIHAGYINSNLSPGVLNGIWLAGDSAGECYGLSGEGIRTAIYYGETVGSLVKLVLEGKLSREEAHGAYNRIISASACSFAVMNWAQQLYLTLPHALSDRIWPLLFTSKIINLLTRRYWAQPRKAQEEMTRIEQKVYPERESAKKKGSSFGGKV